VDYDERATPTENERRELALPPWVVSFLIPPMLPGMRKTFYAALPAYQSDLDPILPNATPLARTRAEFYDRSLTYALVRVAFSSIISCGSSFW
jgi:hypothetical protein